MVSVQISGLRPLTLGPHYSEKHLIPSVKIGQWPVLVRTGENGYNA
jgi:hypothetical protein